MMDDKDLLSRLPRQELVKFFEEQGLRPDSIQYLLSKTDMSREAILRAIDAGRIFIHPFKMENVGTAQYDVSLGPYFFRENKTPGMVNVYNPYDEEHVRRVWGTEWAEAEILGDWRMRNKHPVLKNIPDDERVIWLDPGETILAHTDEFIGGADNTVTTMMKARSSMGRNFIEVCKCAGLGDVGYCNRWTMEITNNSQRYQIPLVVGRRMAQLIFLETEGIRQDDDDYTADGKYQTTQDHKKMMDDWTPLGMLPKMYNDREVRALEDKLK
ncbi:hypothetical protein ACFL96_16210 [Thermoproteota archaeon]